MHSAKGQPMKELYQKLGIQEKVYSYGQQFEEKLKDRFAELDKTAEYNQLKVIRAMQAHKVSAECFMGTTGYGYNDLGRDTLEEVYATCFHGEAALVRPQITCGTHALALALMSNLRPGDELLSPAGKPYDTLEEVIGIRPSKGPLQSTASLTARWTCSQAAPLTTKPLQAPLRKKQSLLPSSVPKDTKQGQLFPLPR